MFARARARGYCLTVDNNQLFIYPSISVEADPKISGSGNQDMFQEAAMNHCSAPTAAHLINAHNSTSEVPHGLCVCVCLRTRPFVANQISTH